MMMNGSHEPEELLVTRDGPVVTITFNRPEARNAVTWSMYERLRHACEQVDADESVRVVVLRGAGGQAFVAGTDISQFTTFQGAADGIEYERQLDASMERLERVKIPVIAQIEGYAVGAGLELVSVCDIRIATPDARFGAPIARTLGNCLSMAAYSTLIDLLGASRVKELIFTARLLSADEARATGFVHEVVSREEIAGRVAALAGRITGHAPITLQVTKEALRRIKAARRASGDEDLIGRAYGSADFKEGVHAFLEKRTPRWSGH
jgi:enoyl-CoA hydratase